MQSSMTPDSRLLTALPYLKTGCRVIDVGTDHAYLPIYLVQQGIASAVLACDINRGPIESARANIHSAQLDAQIQTLQTDGLNGTSFFSPDNILIFGMGGELILRILRDAEWVKNPNIGLILQPMSRANLLRRFLVENGFCIEGESLSYEGKYYQTIATRYCGVIERYSEEEEILGRWNLQTPSPLFEGFLKHEISVYEAILKGKQQSLAADASYERHIIQLLKQRLEEIK